MVIPLKLSIGILCTCRLRLLHIFTCCIDDVIINVTSIVVKTTIVLSVKSSKLKNNDRKPMKTNNKV